MGASSPPFLYNRPSTYSFYGPTDHSFSPKAVTQASWAREPPKPKPKGPLVNITRPSNSDSILPNGTSKWQPMSPSTKGRVKYARLAQLLLRIVAFIGALGLLFCSIVITGATVTVTWIVRATPAVGVLHALYGIYHLCRSPAMRPPASQSIYMLFASTLDAGLVPFYAFTAFVAYGQYTVGEYGWGTLFRNVDAALLIAKVTFLLSAINAGLHLVSLGVSIFLAVIFRQISRLSPDLNPLENSLTSRLHKHNKSEMMGKNSSQSCDSLGSDIPPLDYTVIDPPRSMPFMPTRNESSTNHFGSMSSHTPSRRSFKSHRYSNSQSSGLLRDIPGHPLRPRSFVAPMHEVRTFPTQRNANEIQGGHDDEPTSSAADENRSASSSSGNWVAYPSRKPSPAEKVPNENHVRRQTSSTYSRSNTNASSNSGFKDWISSVQQYRRSLGNVPANSSRGGYASLSMQEYYAIDGDEYEFLRADGQDENAEKDLGDHHISIYTDHDEEVTDPPKINPLALNPPTPRLAMNDVFDDETGNSRSVLTDIPNLPFDRASLRIPSIEQLEDSERYYADLNGDSGLSTDRAINEQEEESARVQVLVKKRSVLSQENEKRNSYMGLIKQRGLQDEQLDSVSLDGDRDRKGRVVSNSGADLGSISWRSSNSGLSLSYGNYIAGLGVRRSRNVSGKLAEEGRSGSVSQLKNPGSAENTALIALRGGRALLAFRRTSYSDGC